jgi:C1A family cysteine protease
MRTYGWRRDSLDQRDHRLSLPQRRVSAALPDTLDMQLHMPGVYDQGQLGSCTANGIAGAIEYRRRRQKLPDFVPSRLFIYWNERVIEGTPASDAGAEIRDGIKSVATQGACSEDIIQPSPWPYDITQFAAQPPQACFDQAKRDLVASYATVDQTDVDAIRAALVSDYPVVFGFTVYDGFENMDGDFVCPLPHDVDVPLGGHCVVICGYDHPKQLFKCRNSYGKGWGLAGYFWMPYAYITNTDISADYWTIDTVA